jgi:hypothetical protein
LEDEKVLKYGAAETRKKEERTRLNGVGYKLIRMAHGR